MTKVIFALVVFVAFGFGVFGGIGAGVATVKNDKRAAGQALALLLASLVFLFFGLAGLLHG